LLIWALLELFGRNAPEVLEHEPVVTAPGLGRPGTGLFGVPRMVDRAGTWAVARDPAL
jgi:hypothetical protein